jgi:hypothetical protein
VYVCEFPPFKNHIHHTYDTIFSSYVHLFSRSAVNSICEISLFIYSPAITHTKKKKNMQGVNLMCVDLKVSLIEFEVNKVS